MKDTIINLTPPIDGVQYGYNSDEIKHGDWCWYANKVLQAYNDTVPYANSHSKKVILSTNPKDTRFPFLQLPSKEQEVEKLANDWYKSVLQRTGLDLTPNRRSLNGFIAGFNANKGYTQEQMEKAIDQTLSLWINRTQGKLVSEITNEVLQFIQPTPKTVRVEMELEIIGQHFPESSNTFTTSGYKIKVETSSEFEQGIVKALGVIY